MRGELPLSFILSFFVGVAVTRMVGDALFRWVASDSFRYFASLVQVRAFSLSWCSPRTPPAHTPSARVALDLLPYRPVTPVSVLSIDHGIGRVDRRDGS